MAVAMAVVISLPYTILKMLCDFALQKVAGYRDGGWMRGNEGFGRWKKR